MHKTYKHTEIYATLWYSYSLFLQAQESGILINSMLCNSHYTPIHSTYVSWVGVDIFIIVCIPSLSMFLTWKSSILISLWQKSNPPLPIWCLKEFFRLVARSVYFKSSFSPTIYTPLVPGVMWPLTLHLCFINELERRWWAYLWESFLYQLHCARWKH